MEFYELLEKIIHAIPAEYATTAAALSAALPWILGFCSAVTCFFGHKIHKIWNAFFFFWIGFLVPVFVIGLLTDPNETGMQALIGFGVICGALCAFFSKKLFKLQLFVTAFFMVFATAPAYLTFIGQVGSLLAGFVIAVVAGILNMKYKYIMTILTTAFSGAFLLFGVFEAQVGLSHTAATILSLAVGAAGFALQCFVERKELQESWEQLQQNYKNAKKKILHQTDDEASVRR